MTQQFSSKEDELQSLLARERETNEQFKQCYQAVKEDRDKLKEELIYVQQVLEEKRLKSEQDLSSKDNLIKKLEEKLGDKQREILKLSNEIKSHDPERIRDKVLEEVTNFYDDKINECCTESDKFREQYNALRQEHAILKSKFESRESEYTFSIGRLNVEHLHEIGQLQSKIESLERLTSFPGDSSAIELKNAKHEILQLTGKFNSLAAECEELRAQNDRLTLQLTSSERNHSKQITDNMITIRSLESEKQKAARESEKFQRESASYQEQKRILNDKLQSSRQEIFSLRSKLEDCEHKYQMMRTELQVENDQMKNGYQSQRQQLIDELTTLKANIREMAIELDHTQQLLVSKDQELQQNLTLAQQQFRKQSIEFQQERERIENKFQDYKTQREQFISRLSEEIQILQHNLQICSESKLELEKEFVSVKEKLEETLKSIDTAATIPKENSTYQKEIQELREEVNRLKSSCNFNLEEKDKLVSDLFSGQRINKSNEEVTEILELKLSWEQQKLQFHQRLLDMESQLKEVKHSSEAERKDLELKIQKYSRAVNKLKEKLELFKVKNEELQTQKEILEKNVPVEVHLQVKNKLTELQRRVEEYRMIIGAEHHFHATSRPPAAPVSDMLLMDIKNLQLKHPAGGDAGPDYEALKLDRENLTDKAHAAQSKKYHPRRRSIRTRSRDVPSKTISPVITSSSDLELENL